MKGSSMQSLTVGEEHALHKLADKHAGNLTAFVNIADARRLTELGLAIRNQQGWDITASGVAHLASLHESTPTRTAVLPMAIVSRSRPPRSE